MTIEIFDPAPVYEIQNAGPYAVPHPYEAGALRLAVIEDGEITDLQPAQYTVTPERSASGGTITLGADTLAGHMGGHLTIWRETPEEQGWVGVQGEREKGLEVQLDRIVMILQELREVSSRSLRATTAIAPFEVPLDGRTIVFQDGSPVGGPSITDIGNALSYAERAEAAAEMAENLVDWSDLSAESLPALLASTHLWAQGAVIVTRAEGYRYRVVPAGSVDLHLTTAGGVGLSILPGPNGYDIGAAGAVGDGATDNAAAIAVAITLPTAAGDVVDGGGRVYKVTALPDLSKFTNATFLVDGARYPTRDLDPARLGDLALAAPAFEPVATNASVRTIINGDDGYHRHFGSMAADDRGVLHLFYRRALGHATYYEGALCYRRLDHNGYQIGAEQVLVPIRAGWDMGAPKVVITPTGRIVATYAQVSLPASAATPVEFFAIHKDVQAAEWSAPIKFATINGARNYGAVKVVPSQRPGQRWKLISPYYGRDGSGTRRVGVFESYDWGESWQTVADNYLGADSALTEMAVAFINARSGFAATRRNGGRLHWQYTGDGGLTWTAPVEVTWGTTADVSPSLDVIYQDGVPYLLLGYCDRSADQTCWRWAPAHALRANAEAMVHNVVATSTAMIEASGYQSPVIYPSGEMAYVEFVERAYGPGGINDPVATDVRLIWANPAKWLAGMPLITTLGLRGATTAGSPTITSSGAWFSKQPNGLVTVNFRMAISAIGGMEGRLQITGLPYSIKDHPLARPTFPLEYVDGTALADGHLAILAVGVPGGRDLDLYIRLQNGRANLTPTHITSSFACYGEFSYFTDE